LVSFWISCGFFALIHYSLRHWFNSIIQ
jgi:hypothetical protein